MKIVYSLLLTTCMSLVFIASSSAEDQHNHKDESAEEHGHEHHKHEGEHHDDAHHGGIVSHVDGTHYELVAEEDKLIFYAEGLPEGDALKTVQVHLTILQGKEKQSVELQLAEEDGHRFEADGAFKLEGGDKVVATIRQGEETPKLVRFELSSVNEK